MVRSEKRFINGQSRPWILRVWFSVLLAVFVAPLGAEIYEPPGYSGGENLGETNWGLDFGFKEVAEDYYLVLTPTVRFQVWKLSMGLELPLEVLAYDSDPKGDKAAGSIREGFYDEWADAARIVTFIRYGKHNYYNPEDAFNWSLFLGRMNDGYIGHRTIVHRYVTTYDPTVYRMGMMADINNRWGGIEVFQSDVFRKEVVGGRAYIRPVHWFTGIRNLLVAGSSSSEYRNHIAATSYQFRDPDLNGGVFYQEKIPDPGEGGRLEQHLYNPLKKDLERMNRGDVKFEEVKDPTTGDVQVRAIPVPPEDQKSIESPIDPIDQKNSKDPGSDQAANGEKPIEKQDGSEAPGTVAEASGEKGSFEESMSPLDSGFWSRWAIGYSLVKDYGAPLSLETDGSGNLVIDPETGLPRSAKTENFVIHGVDTEIRLSPVDWMDLTPYVDHNTIRDLDGANGTHVGINTEFHLGSGMKFYFRPEYRDMSSNYLPVYFDSYYAAERGRYNPGASSNTSGTGMTKLEYLKGLPRRGPRIQGMYAEFMFEFIQYFVLEFSYEDYTGTDNSRVFVGVYVPTIFGFFMNGYYSKKNFDQFDTAFDVDDRSLMAGEVGYELFSGFYVKVTGYRTWKYEESSSAYLPEDEIVYGFGFSSVL